MSWFRSKKQSTVSHDEARRIQRAWWEWQQQNLGVPIFEASIDREGAEVQWHGPQPDEILGVDDECSWCGGDGVQECDDPIQCTCQHFADGLERCSACRGSGLAKDQVVW